MVTKIAGRRLRVAGWKSRANRHALDLLGESSRYRALAEQAALRALIGPLEKRQAEEQLARQHAIRSETYKDAARLLQPTTDHPQPATHNQQPATHNKQI